MVAIRFAFGGGESFTLILDRFGGNVSNAAPAFEAMADYQKGLWTNQFRTEGAFGGSRWPALSPPYAQWKAKHYPGKLILDREGDLKRSLTQRPFGVDVIRETSMVIGTDVEHAIYHQRGGGSLPQRKIITPTKRQDSKEFARILQEWIVKGTVG